MYSTKGKDKVLRCSLGVEWDAVITNLRKKARLLATTEGLGRKDRRN
jgi:hypothetical protein